MKKPSRGGYELTPELLLRIDSLSKQRGVHWRDFARERSWKRWHSEKVRKLYEAGNPSKMRFCSAEEIATALGMDVQELLGEPVLDFALLSATAREIDDDVLEVIRALHELDTAKTKSTYAFFLENKVKEHDYSVQSLLSVLNDPSAVASIESTVPSPDLFIEVGVGFSYLQFALAKGGELRIESPELLWDCPCETPRLAGLESDADAKSEEPRCAIHDSENGSEIENTFRTGLVEISWNGLKFLWRRENSLWPPSIDSFQMMNALRDAGMFEARIPRLLDLGSGTGFLGIAMAHANRTIEHVSLADWLVLPALYGAVNWSRNRHLLIDKSYEVKLGLLQTWLGASEDTSIYDVLVCNPPYLPLLPGFERLGFHATVAGTDLLCEVVRNGSKTAKSVFVQFSSLAAKDAMQAAVDSHSRIKPVGDGQEIPFRVWTVWEVPEYLDALIQERGLIFRPGSAHPVWHQIQTYRIR